MPARTRPYLFYDTAVSLCTTCYRRIDAKLVFEDDNVFMLKRCPQHGFERVLISDDVDYYRRCREVFIKPPEMPDRYNTPIKYGCPYDCGLCPDHEQHSCLSLLEINDACNLSCPICYAQSGTHRTEYKSLDQIERMLDCIVTNEAEPDVVQISGGEPTIHPHFFDVLDAAKRRPIRHLMVNTNGIRIAQDEAFAQRLATYMPKFELYLQFDSLPPRPAHAAPRSRPPQHPRTAPSNASTHSASPPRSSSLSNAASTTTNSAASSSSPCSNPASAASPSSPSSRPAASATTTPPPTASRSPKSAAASSPRPHTFKPEDLIPVPCHPDSLAMAYAMKLAGKVVPLTGLVSPDVLINGGRNTIIYEQDPAIRASIEQNPNLRNQIFKLFSTNHSPQSQASTLRELLCCLPQVLAPKNLGYDNLFRILIVQFIDAQTFDLRTIKKTCIHIAHPDAQRLIPFDTYNMFYRDTLEETRLKPLRDQTLAYM